VDAGLGVWIALHADGLARAFARARVGLRALSAHGQAAHMANAAIAFDALQPLKIHAEFAAQIALNDVFAFLDRVDDLRKLGFGQILRASRPVNVRAFEDLQRVDGTDALDVAQRNVNALVRRNFNTNDTCHKIKSTLPLLVPFVRADHANDATTAHNLAMLAQFFYRCPDFHS
jgi:hypothetical protein